MLFYIVNYIKGGKTMAKEKIIFIDVDGTLLDYENK